MLYFGRCEGTNIVKIGYTGKDDATQRLIGLQTGCPYTLSVELLLEGTRQDETRLHKTLSSRRLRGEWFMLTSYEVEQITNESPYLEKTNISIYPDHDSESLKSTICRGLMIGFVSLQIDKIKNNNFKMSVFEKESVEFYKHLRNNVEYITPHHVTLYNIWKKEKIAEWEKANPPDCKKQDLGTMNWDNLLLISKNKPPHLEPNRAIKYAPCVELQDNKETLALLERLEESEKNLELSVNIMRSFSKYLLHESP